MGASQLIPELLPFLEVMAGSQLAPESLHFCRASQLGVYTGCKFICLRLDIPGKFSAPNPCHSLLTLQIYLHFYFCKDFSVLGGLIFLPPADNCCWRQDFLSNPGDMAGFASCTAFHKQVSGSLIPNPTGPGAHSHPFTPPTGYRGWKSGSSTHPEGVASCTAYGALNSPHLKILA